MLVWHKEPQRASSKGPQARYSELAPLGHTERQQVNSIGIGLAETMGEEIAQSGHVSTQWRNYAEAC